MAIFLEKRNRLIIPRWREYNRKVFAVEHFPNSKEVTDFQNLETDKDFILKELEWKQTRSIPAAIELVNASISLDLKNKGKEAALLLKAQQNLPSQLSRMVKNVLDEDVENYTDGLEILPFQSFFRFIGKKINSLRKRLFNYPYNPLLWLELARLHSILGNNIKAEDCLTVAYALSKRLNREITRAYSRFYYHIGDTDRAHEIIRQSPMINTDPWIMSAEISYSLKRNRFSPNVKKGMSSIESNNFDSFEISELASMIGTIEFHNGSNKSAKKFVGTSLLKPNDNSLAQAEWLSRELNNISFYNWLEKVDFAYEARAHEFLYEKKFEESLKQGFFWVIDQPFSKRAIQFSSYVASALVNDQKSAIEVCTIGLRSNPESFEIINNLVYAYALNGQTKEAQEWLQKLIQYSREEKHKIFVLANEGLLLFRTSEVTQGRTKYREAIELAIKLKEDRLKLIAQINLAREEYLAKQLSRAQVIALFEELKNSGFSINEELEAALDSIKKKELLK